MVAPAAGGKGGQEPRRSPGGDAPSAAKTAPISRLVDGVGKKRRVCVDEMLSSLVEKQRSGRSCKSEKTLCDHSLMITSVQFLHLS